MGRRSLALAAALIVAGAIIGVLYPYSLFYTSPETQLLVIKATLALAGLLAGALISSAGIALIAALKGEEVEAEAAGEGEEGREGG